MIQPEKLFDNFLDDNNIIPCRFSNFANYTINNLIANNGSGQLFFLLLHNSSSVNEGSWEVEVVG